MYCAGIIYGVTEIEFDPFTDGLKPTKVENNFVYHVMDVSGGMFRWAVNDNEGMRSDVWAWTFLPLPGLSLQEWPDHPLHGWSDGDADVSLKNTVRNLFVSQMITILHGKS
jgi:hypothetical protein